MNLGTWAAEVKPLVVRFNRWWAHWGSNPGPTDQKPAENMALTKLSSCPDRVRAITARSHQVRTVDQIVQTIRCSRSCDRR